MKKLGFLILIILSFGACKQKGGLNSTSAGQDSVSTGMASLPYKALYSAEFFPGKQSDSPCNKSQGQSVQSGNYHVCLDG